MEEMHPDNVLIQEEPRTIARIRWMRQASCAGTAEMMTYSRADFVWLTSLLGAVADPGNYGLFSMVTDLSAVETYRSKDGEPLPGLIEDSDCGGVPCWKFPSEVEETPWRETTPVDQMNFLEHYLLPQLAVGLTIFIAELTPERALRLKPGVLPQLEQLAQILVTLDLMNSDEARPFDLRPNPQFDIFGDACHDVLFRRLQAAKAFLVEQPAVAAQKPTVRLSEDDNPV